MDVAVQLTQIAASGDQKQRADQYKTLLGNLVQAAAEADINTFVDHSRCPKVSQINSVRSLPHISSSIGIDRRLSRHSNVLQLADSTEMSH